MCTSKPPRSPLEMGAVKLLYAGLGSAAGGFTKDFPSAARSLSRVSICGKCVFGSDLDARLK